MKHIVYIGHKPLKADSVAKTGLTWQRGEVHEVDDDEKATKLLEHPHVWADADSDYKLLEIPKEEISEPEPKVLIVPQGGTEISPYWDPITIVVPAEVFKSLQDKETIAVFMKPADADAYESYKKEHEEINFDPSTADKRSRLYKDWAAKNPEEAKKHLEAA
jgi:hypothetical protein